MRSLTCLILSFTAVASARGAVAVYIGNDDISIQGFRGEMFLPVVQSVTPPGVGSVAGVSASDSDLYTLFSGALPGSNSTLTVNDAQSGAYLQTIPLSVPLSDIAFTNGQLYGLETTSNSIQIVSIGNSGTVEPVAMQSATTTNVNWRLSGAVDGDSLLASGVPLAGSAPPAYTIDPATAAINAFSFSQSPGRYTDAVINLAGNTVTFVGSGIQPAYAYPSGVFQGQVPVLSQYPPFIESDEFTYNYSATDAAYASIGLSGTISFGNDGLFRMPVSFTATPWLLNGASPDGTTLSNVAVAPGVQILTQVAGPTAATVTETQLAAGTYSFRQLSTDTITLPSSAQRGVYQFGITANALTATYSYASTVDQNREVANEGFPIITIAYDPVSANLVGNGDLTLGSAGWEANPFGTNDAQDYSNTSVSVSGQGIQLLPSSSFPFELRQFLQLPTADQPMELSFTAETGTTFPGTADVQAYLGGTLVGNFQVNSTSTQTFQTEITDPSLFDLSDAELRFVATPTTQGTVELYLDNFSLTAVPEPASIGLIGLTAATLLRRRRRNQANATPTFNH